MRPTPLSTDGIWRQRLARIRQWILLPLSSGSTLSRWYWRVIRPDVGYSRRRCPPPPTTPRAGSSPSPGGQSGTRTCGTAGRIGLRSNELACNAIRLHHGGRVHPGSSKRRTRDGFRRGGCVGGHLASDLIRLTAERANPTAIVPGAARPFRSSLCADRPRPVNSHSQHNVPAPIWLLLDSRAARIRDAPRLAGNSPVDR